MSDYGYTRELNLTFHDAIKRVEEELMKEGFGVLTRIDVRSALKKKLNEDFEDYMILGACNPLFAFKALKAEKEIGLLLPCNIIIYSEDKKTFVSAINPSAIMSVVGHGKIEEIASEVRSKLNKVIDNL